MLLAVVKRFGKRGEFTGTVRVHPIYIDGLGSTVTLTLPGLPEVSHLKVPCAPKQIEAAFSYSSCTNYVGAVTHNERRFQFRRGQLHGPNCSGCMGKSRIHRWRSPSELKHEIRSCA